MRLELIADNFGARGDEAASDGICWLLVRKQAAAGLRILCRQLT
jgi:hypothetical protein